MSNLRQFEVSFTAYYDEAQTQTDTNLMDLRTRIAAENCFQAEAMIKAQYRFVHIWSVFEV